VLDELEEIAVIDEVVPGEERAQLHGRGGTWSTRVR